MVFQHFQLADNLTVTENVVLGAEKLHGIGDKAESEIRRISDAYGFGLDPDELVEDLGVGERQRVEILKVLYRGAKIIILDEPTAVLVPQEVDALFAQPPRAQGRGPHADLHLAQARRGARRSPTTSRCCVAAPPSAPSSRPTSAARARRAHGRRRAAQPEHRGVDGHRPRGARGPRPDRARRRGPGRARRHRPRHPRGRGARHRRRRGQRPDRAGRGRHRHAEADGRRRRARTAGRHRLGDARAARLRRRLHPRGPPAPRAAARRAAVGEPHPRPPDPHAVVKRHARSTAGCPRGHRAHRRAVRRPHARHRHHRPRPVGRQPAEVHRRAGDERRTRRCWSRRTRPAASTSAPRRRSGTTSARPAAAGSRCC